MKRLPVWFLKCFRALYTARPWRTTIGLAVLVNSAVLGAITEVPEGSALSGQLAAIDGGLLILLVFDVMLCISVKRRNVLRSGWDVFDITITLVSVLPSVGMLSALRVLRVIRVLRLISFVPHGRATVDALLNALRNMTAAFVILAVVFYSFVVIATNLFRDIDPAHYGSLGRSATHLYSVMVSLGSNLESETVFGPLPWAYLIFGIFIVVASFGLLNMFIAVLVAALKEQLDQENVLEERAHFARLEEKVDALSSALKALHARE
jgi:voltage-gated sodium channel